MGGEGGWVCRRVGLDYERRTISSHSNRKRGVGGGVDREGRIVGLEYTFILNKMPGNTQNTLLPLVLALVPLQKFPIDSPLAVPFAIMKMALPSQR